MISLGLLQRAGATIRGISFGICLAWEGKDFLQANLIGSQGTLYRIKTMKTSLVNNQMAFIASESTMRLWHRRFGHISPRTIKTMIDQDMVTGLEIKLPREFDRLCSGCAQGKSIRPPLPEHSKTKYGTNELIVIDLIGPMSVSTWDGYNYALVAVEASKRYPKARLLKRKEETGDNTRDIIAQFERQTGQLVKIIRTDNGNKFVNKLMNKFCSLN